VTELDAFEYRALLLLSLGVTLLLASGCDTGSKRDSLYQGLVGKTWEIQRVYLDGNSIPFAEQTVQLEFLSQEGGRSFRLSRIVSADTSTVTGRVGVPQDNILSMTGSFSLVWRFTFEKPEDVGDSVQFQLRRATDGSVPSFLNAIGLSGGARSLTIDFVRAYN